MASITKFLSRVAFGEQGRWESAIMPLLLMLTTPYFVLALWITSAEHGGSFLDFLLSTFSSADSTKAFLLLLWESPSVFAFKVILAFFSWAVIMTSILPGSTTKGPPTPSGHVPVYRDNGFLYYWVTLSAFSGATIVCKEKYGVSPTIIYDRWQEMIASLNIFALIFCLLLLLKGKIAPSPGSHGSSGNIVFDFYWGLELYPRVFNVDVKQITNCRFGLTAWPLLIIIHGLKSYEDNGGFIPSMWISVGLQLIYITKFFWWEGGYMRTLDIILDKAGYMICWGCLVFVPGFYTSPTLYLVKNPVPLSTSAIFTIVVAGIVTIALNYASDWQKDSVRATNGSARIWGSKAKVIRAHYQVPGSQEKRESLLLVSGFWAVSRHFNYLAEIALAFCWSAPALFTHIYPYCYVIFLTILLVHRTFRDERKCAAKYGMFWKQYCKQVKWRIIPFVF